MFTSANALEGALLGAAVDDALEVLCIVSRIVRDELYCGEICRTEGTLLRATHLDGAALHARLGKIQVHLRRQDRELWKENYER